MSFSSEATKKNQQPKAKLFLISSFFGIIFLTGTLFLTVNLSQKNQDNRSRAQDTVPTPTPGHILLSKEEVWIEDFGEKGINIDQSQLGENGRVSGYKIGQTFIPQGTNIWKVDFRFSNRGSFEPITFKLWEWKTNYAQTVAETPLFSDTVDANSLDFPLTRHVVPKVTVTPGKTYFFELQRPTQPFVVRAGTNNPYTNGTLWKDGVEGKEWKDGVASATLDMTFAIYTGSSESTSLTMKPITGPEPPSNALPLPSTAHTVTKKDYLETVRKFVEANEDAWATDSAYLGEQYKMASHYGFLYKATGNEEYAKKAITSFQKMKNWIDTTTDAIGFNRLPPAVLAYYYIKDYPNLTNSEREMIRQGLAKLLEKHKPIREMGNTNRPIGSGVGYAAMALFFPNDPQAADWKQYSDAVWQSWYTSDDTTENSHGYDAMRWAYLIAWMKIDPTKNVLAEPKIKGWLERMLTVSTPLGPVPPYGSGSGWAYDYGGPTAIFEAAAAANQDGRYKYAAHRTFEYIRRTIKNTDPHLVTYEDMERLGVAYLYADDTIPETYSRNSVWTTRKAINNVPPPEKVRLDPTTVIGDKFHFLSNLGENHISAVFELVGQCGGGHGHCGAPSLIHFSSDDTALLTGTAYFNYPAEDHSTFLFKKLRGGNVTGTPVPHMQITQTINNDTFTFAEFSYGDTFGGQNKLKRQVLLVKNKFLWIRDSADFIQDMEVSLGPVFAAGQKPFSNGANWFDIGWNEPRGYLWRFKNGDKRTLVYFTSESNKKVDWQYQLSKDAEKMDWSPPWILSQRIPNLKAINGTKVHFNSLLIPHEANASAKDLADGIKVLSDSFARTQLSVPTPEGAITVTIDGSHVSVSKPGEQIPTPTTAQSLLSAYLTNSSAGFTAKSLSYTATNDTTTTGVIGDSLSYTATATGTRIRGIEIYVSPQHTQNWSRIGGSSTLCNFTSTCSVTATWKPKTPGQYYVVVNSYSDANGNNILNEAGEKCSGNPFSLGGGWVDCGTDDVATVTINAATPTLTPTSTPSTPAPTASITGSTTGTVGKPLTFTATVLGERITGGAIYVSPTNTQTWKGIGGGANLCKFTSSCSLSGSWTPTTPGDYYVVINGYSDANGDGISNGVNEKCSGNPFSLPGGWKDCGASDIITVSVK